ncbi:Rho termination factor N-terminal domain-containing protein [Pacificimonas sp. WHA3]|uniref:Rho termination factor N-terminal domain-containing protein n=1 Tax=Pacificimonas pallii TaxID=2827236 RepID=A0ABS6SFZ4_9SPHN|nr:Rho termination factor N-terminal domain-containing protein [Pacificimonas pallii]MBV7256826.1 Rho termination factor N-terminal domain-containing protein [Pacificimonas pallii]
MAKDHGPSIKNDRTYQALREEGASKEKAARIANAQAAGSVDHDNRPYEKRTKDELYEDAQEIGIKGRSSMSKDELIEALRRH